MSNIGLFLMLLLQKNYNCSAFLLFIMSFQLCYCKFVVNVVNMEIFLPLSPEINEYALFQNFTKIIHSMKQFGILENTGIPN